MPDKVNETYYQQYANEITAKLLSLPELAQLATQEKWEELTRETVKLYNGGAFGDGRTSFAFNVLYYYFKRLSVIVDVNLNALKYIDQIPSRAFSISAVSLAAVEIPSNITYIESQAFYSSNALESVKFSSDSNLLGIGSQAFELCEHLKEIEIPGKVRTIGTLCFGYCKNLERISIPSSVTVIAPDTFHKCSNLRTIKYAGTFAQWEKINGVPSGRFWKWDEGIPEDAVLYCSDTTVSR